MTVNFDACGGEKKAPSDDAIRKYEPQTHSYAVCDLSPTTVIFHIYYK